MNEPDNPPALPQEPPQGSPARHTSLFARILNIFAVPGDVFEEVRAARHSVANWVVPVLLYGCVAAISTVLILSQPAIRQGMREQQAKQFDKMVSAGKMTREQADRQLEVAQNPVLISTFSGIGAFLFTAVTVMWWAFLLWLIARAVLRSPVPFPKMLEVAGLASMISVLEGIVRLLLVVSFSNPLASPSLAMLMKNPDPTDKVFMLLSVINLMTFWALIVRAIGLSRLAGVRFAKAAGWVFLVWVLMMLAGVGIGSAAKAAFGF